jgi:hypothetical protein
MLIVLDDVLSEEKRNDIVHFFTKSADARNMKWAAIDLNKLEEDQTPMALIVKEAAKYFDLSSMVGVEYWAHLGTRPGWHVDRDENLAANSGKIVHPICSIVYYGNIQDLNGGRFETETETVVPKTNRMLMFSPGILHNVEDYSGVRLSIAVNPWAVKPMGY